MIRHAMIIIQSNPLGSCRLIGLNIIKCKLNFVGRNASQLIVDKKIETKIILVRFNRFYVICFSTTDFSVIKIRAYLILISFDFSNPKEKNVIRCYRQGQK